MKPPKQANQKVEKVAVKTYTEQELRKAVSEAEIAVERRMSADVQAITKLHQESMELTAKKEQQIAQLRAHYRKTSNLTITLAVCGLLLAVVSLFL
jgi:hypothetical protein